MVLVYSDNKNLMLELLNKGSELAKELNKSLIAVIIGKDEFSKDYIAHGADKVVVAETDLDQFKAEEYTDIIEGIVKEDGSEIILIGSNKNGKELAPRLAAKFETGCVTDCTNVYLKDKKLTAERIVYSGNAVAVEQFNTIPQIVTVPSKVFDPLPKDDKHKGEVVKKKIDVEKSSSKILKVQEMKTEGWSFRS
jgi:electron transfer flavoprotein alpha subunit